MNMKIVFGSLDFSERKSFNSFEYPQPKKSDSLNTVVFVMIDEDSSGAMLQTISC